MSNQQKSAPRVKYFEAGGTRYGMLLDFNALCDVEDLTGKPVGELMDDGGSVKAARAVLWGALNGWVRRERPQDRTQFTVNAAGDILDTVLVEKGPAGLEALLAKLGDKSFPKAVDDAEPADSGN